MRVQRMLACGLMLATSAAAADEGLAQEIGLRVGSGGVGLEYGIGLGSLLDLRAGYAFGSLDRTVDVDGIDYETDTKVGAVFGMLDLRPFSGGFRISAGGYSKPPSVDFFTIANNDEYQIGNAQYTATGRLDGDVRMGSFAPYAGLGWGGTTAGTGFGWSFDAGVLFADQPEVALTATGRACDSSAAACDPSNQLTGFDVNGSDPRATTFQDALEQERQNFEKDIESRRYWPVISLGLHYRF
ncbi:MAG: hypothetical protein WC809_03015 [Sinimarinibacterium sp.]